QERVAVDCFDNIYEWNLRGAGIHVKSPVRPLGRRYNTPPGKCLEDFGHKRFRGTGVVGDIFYAHPGTVSRTGHDKDHRADRVGAGFRKHPVRGEFTFYKNPSSSLAASDIMSGEYGGSKVSLIFTSFTDSISSMERFTASAISLPEGHAGLVSVMVTNT